MTTADPRRVVTEPVVRSRGRRRLPAGTRLDFWLDVVLMVAFVVDDSFRFTGVPVHEWVGIAFGVALLGHVTLHWDWVVRTTRRLFGAQPGRERFRWILDLVLLVVMTLCVASGVLISRSALPWLGIRPEGGSFWTGLHTTFADLTVFLVALHVALNWRWILTVGRRLIGRRSRPADRPAVDAVRGVDP